MMRDLEASRLLASSLEAQKDTILFSIDHDYRYLYFNGAHAETMKRAYGVDIETGACVLDYISDADDRAAAKEDYDRALAGESHTNVRVHGDVERACYESFFNPVRDESGVIVGATGLARDITARRRAEEQLADQAARLEMLEERIQSRTSELEAANKGLEAFAYSVSHDLRAPLRHISMFAGILRSDSQDALDDDGRRCLDAISESVREMGALIDDLVQFSRIGRAEMQVGDVDMAAVLEAALAPIRDDAQGRAIEWSIGPLPHVDGDPVLLRQVWANLLENAVKFSRDRDPARIEVGSVNGDTAAADGSPAEHVFFVRDNGVGFDMQYADKLFGVFQRMHSVAEFEGTGIGLANVNRIITRHGGHVWAEAALGEGATFSFAIPRRKGTP